MIPKRLSRYVILEFTKIFLVTLASMTALMLLVGVVQEAIRESLTPLTILKLIPFALPNALCFAIPGTVLFAVCNVLGRMSAGNEVIAIKSLGISPLVVIRPLILVAFLLSLLTVVLNDFAVSWGRQGIYRVVLHSVQNTIYAKLNADKSYRRGTVSMAVQAVDGNDLIGVVVEVHANDKQKPFMMTAQKARLEVDADRNVLVIMTENAIIEGEGISLMIEKDRFELPLEDVTKKRDKSKSPSNLPMRLLTTELGLQKEEIEHQKEEMAITAAFQSLGGDLVGLTDVNWKSAERNLERSVFRKHRLKTEPWRRWANGFSCLFFVIVGAPLAIRLHRADFWTIFALCFVPILVVYYPILMAGVEYAKAGRLPPYVVWAGNLVMLAVGVYLMRHLRRH
jgi:lipopolysaccharide export system permease protein